MKMRKRLARAVSGLALLFLAARSLQATPQVAAPTIDVIRIHGQKRFTAEQIIGASGLKAGQPFAVTTLTNATNRLGDTGAFATVRYNYKNEAGKLVVEFVVQEAENFHACVFDNQIWFTDAELMLTIRAQIPLFDGTAPEAGSMGDDVATALEKSLKARGVAGQVSRSVHGGLGSRNWEHLYTVSGVTETVVGVSFEGVKNLDVSLLNKEAAPLMGRDYSLVEFRSFGKSAFVPVYREHGYLQMKLGETRTHSSQVSDSTQRYDVQVTYPVTEGIKYNWHPIVWTGATVFTPADLEKLIGLKQGETANGRKIDEGWNAVHGEYGRKGYIEAMLKPEASFDDVAQSVTYTVAVVEGAQYHMGSVSFSGFPAPIVETLTKHWKLKPGDVFDRGYLKEFLQNDFRSVLQSGRIAVRQVKTQELPDRERKIVNMTIQGE